MRLMEFSTHICIYRYSPLCSPDGSSYMYNIQLYTFRSKNSDSRVSYSNLFRTNFTLVENIESRLSINQNNNEQTKKTTNSSWCMPNTNKQIYLRNFCKISYKRSTQLRKLQTDHNFSFFLLIFSIENCKLT